MALKLIRLGAVTWGLWGLLHAGIGASALLAAMRGNVAGALAVLAGSAPPSAAVGLDPALVGLVANHAFNLLWGGLFALAVALLFNWRGSRWGYWANLAVIAGFDLGFIAFVVAPGHIPLATGVVGPALWLIGALLGAGAVRKS